MDVVHVGYQFQSSYGFKERENFILDPKAWYS